jgi:hypothetical protein
MSNLYKCGQQLAVLTVITLAFTGLALAQEGDELFPPNAKPGECYARVFVPPAYKTVSEQALKHEATEELEVVPARYETVRKKVLVKETAERWEIVPATFDTVEERILVRPASKNLVAVPAQYETVTERVVDTPAHTAWKKGRGPVERIDNHTGEIMCLVEVPATYKTVSKRVLRTPATTREVEVPAEYKTVRRLVMTNPPSVRKYEIPAEYATVEVTKLLSPAETRKHSRPAEYQTVTRQEKVSEGHMAWRQVLCETNLTRPMISAIQRALETAGFDPGQVDGVLGSQTLAAVRSFQSTKGLAHGGLTLETVKALGL